MHEKAAESRVWQLSRKIRRHLTRALTIRYVAISTMHSGSTAFRDAADFLHIWPPGPFSTSELTT